MERLEMIMRSALESGAESAWREAQGVRVVFRGFAGSREIGYLEAMVGDHVRLLDHTQSQCIAGQRWAASVSRWVQEMGTTYRNPSPHWPNEWSRLSAKRSRLLN